MDKDVLFKEIKNALNKGGSIKFDETQNNVWHVVYNNVQYDISMRSKPHVKPVKTANEKSNIFKKAKNALTNLFPMSNVDTWAEVKKTNLKTGKQEAIADYTGAQKRFLINSCAYSGLDL